MLACMSPGQKWTTTGYRMVDIGGGQTEDSTTKFNIEEQARGKKRKRKTKTRIYNWTRRLDSKWNDLWMEPRKDDSWTDPGQTMDVCNSIPGGTVDGQIDDL